MIGSLIFSMNAPWQVQAATANDGRVFSIPEILRVMRSLRSVHETLQFVNALSPDPRVMPWISFARAHAEPDIFEIVEVMGNRLTIAGHRGAFTFLADGRVEHDGKIFSFDAKQSPEITARRMQELWGLNSTRTSSIDYLLPQARAATSSSGSFLGLAALLVAVVVCWKAAKRVPALRVFGLAAAVIPAAIIMANRNGTVSIQGLKFECQGKTPRFLSGRVDVTLKILHELPDTPEGEAPSGLARQFGSARALAEHALTKACESEGSMSQHYVAALNTLIGIAQKNGDRSPPTRQGPSYFPAPGLLM